MNDIHEQMDHIEKQKEERIQRKRKMKETIASAIMSIARVAH